MLDAGREFRELSCITFSYRMGGVLILVDPSWPVKDKTINFNLCKSRNVLTHFQ